MPEELHDVRGSYPVGKNGITIKLATAVVVVGLLIGATAYIHVNFAAADDMKDVKEDVRDVELEVVGMKKDIGHIKDDVGEIKKQQILDTQAILNAISNKR